MLSAPTHTPEGWRGGDPPNPTSPSSPPAAGGASPPLRENPDILLHVPRAVCLWAEKGCWGSGCCSGDPQPLGGAGAAPPSLPPSLRRSLRTALLSVCGGKEGGGRREGGRREGTSLSGSISSAASHMLREGDAAPRVPLSEAACTPPGLPAGRGAARAPRPPPPRHPRFDPWGLLLFYFVWVLF